MKRNIIFILGPPCSGKGTQAFLLKNFYHLSAGNLLREKLKNDPVELKAMSEGKLVNKDKINLWIKEDIEERNSQIIIDGYPRSLEQADFITRNFEKRIFKVFVLDVKENILIQRMKNRQFCKSCQRTFNRKTVCCNMKTITRNDDTIEVFKERFRVFNEDFKKIINIFKVPIVYLEGEKEIHTIHQNLQQSLDDLQL